MFPPLLQSYVVQARVNLRANPHQGILHFNAILEPSITQVNRIFSFLSLDGRGLR